MTISIIFCRNSFQQKIVKILRLRMDCAAVKILILTITNINAQKENVNADSPVRLTSHTEKQKV